MAFAFYQPALADEPLSVASVQLWSAAKDGKADAIAAALAAGASVDTTSANGIPALVVAVMSGKTDAVVLLLDAGAKGINESYAIGKARARPLAIATWGGDAQVAKLLLERGAILMADNGEAWRGAIVSESLETVQTLLTAGADPGYRFADGELPVTVTALRGNLPVMAALLEKKSCGGCRNDQGTTPLMYAAARGHESVVELLIKHSALLYPVNTNGLNAYKAAQQNKDSESRDRIATLLLKHGASKQTQNRELDEGLLQAAYAGDVARAKDLLDKGADIEARGLPNTTLWLRDVLVASVKHPAMCRLLLDKGANSRARDDADFTVLHSAASDGSADCIKLLAEHGADADANAKARHGQTPLYMAVNNVRTANVAALLAVGANPNEIADGESLLAMAKRRQMTKIVQLLDGAGAK
jgi:ankyrin repeat protein